MKSSLFISIIIPVYNAELDLERCLANMYSSLDYSIEIILVNDGSTDRSGQLCDELAGNDERIRVIHQKNKGVSAARNRGIKEAKGDWIWFVDADDKLISGVLDEIVVLLMKNKERVDVLMFGYETINQRQIVRPYGDANVEEYVNKIEAFEWMFRPKYDAYQGFVWTKIFRRNIIVNNNLQFDEHIFFNEDRLFCCSFFDVMTKDMLFISKVFYSYYLNSEGAMESLSKSFNPKFITDLYAMLEMQAIVRKFGNQQLIEEVRSAVLHSILWNRDLMNAFSIKDINRWLYLKKMALQSLRLSDFFNPVLKGKALSCLKLIVFH